MKFAGVIGTLLFCIVLASSCLGQEKSKEEPRTLKFFEGMLSDANEYSKENEKGFFVVLWNDEENPVYQHYRENVFTDSILIETLETKFVCLSYKSDSEGGKSLSNQFGKAIFPTFFFVSTSGEQLFSVEKKLDADQIMDYIERRVLND